MPNALAFLILNTKKPLDCEMVMVQAVRVASLRAEWHREERMRLEQTILETSPSPVT